MQPLPIFGTSLKALAAQSSAQERINVFFGEHQDGDKSNIYVRDLPATTLFCQLPQAPIRGMIAVDNYLYAVADNGLYQIGSTGNYVLLGKYGNSGQFSPLKMAYNGKQLFIADGSNGGWIYNYANLVSSVTVQVNTILSDMTDVTAIAALAAAQGSSPSGTTIAPELPPVRPRTVIPRYTGS